MLEGRQSIEEAVSMSTMQAVVVEPSSEHKLGFQELPVPSPLPSEALVKVSAVSLNRGEVRRAQAARAGTQIGWDLAGTVAQAAADGSGPREGARVVGFVPSGAWAEYVAVPSHALAPLPDEVSFAQAATLPVAGLTALHALDKGGNLLGRSVLVTGASGGVGHFAVQLAGLAGARVTALVRRDEHFGLVEDAGAQQVVVSEHAHAAAEFAPYHLVVESVGGEVLARVLTMLSQGGTCVSLGTSATHEATIDARQLFATGGASLYGFILFHELKREPAQVGLARLANLVASGRLRPLISLEQSWDEVGSVATQLLERRFVGKAVLHVAQ